MKVCVCAVLSQLCLASFAGDLRAQSVAPPPRPTVPIRQSAPVKAGPGPQDLAASRLRGVYGPYRANNDLLSYKLRVRVDPTAKTIRGDNQIRFRMLATDSRIQVDLYPDLAVEKILMDGRPLEYTREGGQVFVNFPQPLHEGEEYTIDFFYGGQPKAVGRFGGMTFGKDPSGEPWIVTSIVRRRWVEHLVAQQGPVARRTAGWHDD